MSNPPPANQDIRIPSTNHFISRKSVFAENIYKVFAYIAEGGGDIIFFETHTNQYVLNRMNELEPHIVVGNGDAKMRGFACDVQVVGILQLEVGRNHDGELLKISVIVIGSISISFGVFLSFCLFSLASSFLRKDYFQARERNLQEYARLSEPRNRIAWQVFRIL